MGFSRVDHEAALLPPCMEHRLRGRHDGLEQRHVVAQRFAEAAGFDEVALHVDDDEGCAVQLELVGEGVGV